MMAILGLLTAAALSSGFHVPVAGRRVRPEHIAAPLLFATFAVLQWRRRLPVTRIDVFSLLAIGWVVANAVSSWFFAPNWPESRVHVLRMGLLAATFLTAANLTPHPSQWASRLRLWLALCLVALSYGVAAWLVARFTGIWLPGVGLEHAISGISVHGTLMERNLYGIRAASVFALLAYVLIARRTGRQPGVVTYGVLGAACGLAGVAMALSLTRSAWLAIVVAAPLTYLLLDRRSLTRADRPLLLASAGLPVALVGMVGAMWLIPAPAPTGSVPGAMPTLEGQPARSWGRQPAVSPVIQRPASGTGLDTNGARITSTVPGLSDRIRTLGSLDSDFTVSTRLQDAKWAIEDWWQSPLLGRGTGSFGQIHGIRVGTHAWLSSLVLHTLVDTGLIGLAIQMSLFSLIAIGAWRAAAVTRHPALATGLRAMTLAFLVLMIAYQVTDGSWLAIFWIHLGLMVNGIYCVREETRMIPGTDSR